MVVLRQIGRSASRFLFIYGPQNTGRKNWLFAGAPNGADAAAAFFSLIETAKANGLIFVVYLNSNRYQNY
jgi:hypothetical protein